MNMSDQARIQSAACKLLRDIRGKSMCGPDSDTIQHREVQHKPDNSDENDGNPSLQTMTINHYARCLLARR
jgi:hypothetical protein